MKRSVGKRECWDAEMLGCGDVGTRECWDAGMLGRKGSLPSLSPTVCLHMTTKMGGYYVGEFLEVVSRTCCWTTQPGTMNESLSVVNDVLCSTWFPTI